ASELRVALEAVDRTDLGEQLRCGERSAAGQLEQPRCELRGPLFQFAVELEDGARERAAAEDKVACEPCLDLRLATGEPAAYAVELRRPVEMTGRNGKGRVELMEVPAHALLRTSAFVDQIVTVIDQKLQLTKRLLVRSRPA